MAEDGNGERRERESKAAQLAYEQGKKDAGVNARFDRLERHARDVNGSIDRMVRALAKLEQAQHESRVSSVEQFATFKTKLGFYAAIGSLVGGGVVTLIVAFAAKAGGG